MSDEVRSVYGRPCGGGISKTPRESVRDLDEEFSEEPFEFDTPLTRTRTVTDPDTARVETAYILLKESGTFNGPDLVRNGLDKRVLKYVRGGSLWTFLHQAAYWNHEKAIEWLLTHGANAYAKDKDGKTPMDVAREMTHDRALTMFRCYTAAAAPCGGGGELKPHMTRA